MNFVQETRGAAPVGQLLELPPVEMTAIIYLRMWCEGGPSRIQVRRDFIMALGETDGKLHNSVFASFMLILMHKSRRKIMRHGINCQCFGGDESAVANMIAAAAAGDYDEAVLLAAHLVHAHTADELVKPAEEIGLVFNRMLGRFSDTVIQTHRPSKSKH